MKKDNDELTESLQYLIDGGDKQRVVEILQQKGLDISPPSSPEYQKREQASLRNDQEL